MTSRSSRTLPRTASSASRLCGGNRSGCSSNRRRSMATVCPLLAAARLLRRLDVDLHGGAHRPVQPNGDLEGAELADRLVRLDPALVDRLAEMRRKLFGDVAAGDGAVEPAL